MPLNEFWYGDVRLLECYTKAYYRRISYESWKYGHDTFIAHNIALHNGFGLKKGQQPQQYPKWEDPMSKYEKPVLTKENLETEFRKEQIKQNTWLRNLLDKFRNKE